MSSPAIRPPSMPPVAESTVVESNGPPDGMESLSDSSSHADTRVAVNAAAANGQEEAAGGLIRVDRTYYHNGTDLSDYDNKFAEDQPFEEMAPMARVFKMCLEEYGKLDGDRTEDWRDGLDVLLVFAGVFSAVVSTLVSQTSQNLQVDFGEISAHLMTEMVLLQRAAMNNLPDSSVPVSDVTLTSALRVSRTDTWVNGLWFTSLALSLAAALIAVLTKQWIHQFLTSTSGTAQDRVRIRQFRYEQLKEWHVPLIIGVLPIFMHISLGAFLAGLVVYVRSLSTPISIAVGIITFMAFVLYFGTNLHPIFHPASPYKTFLTRYTYRLYCGLCERLSGARIAAIAFVVSAPPSDPITTTPSASALSVSATTSDTVSLLSPSKELSLERVEKLMVARVAPQLDARALSDLYNLSSNTSVQSIILQSFSDLPFQTIPVVKERIPKLDKDLEGCVQSVEYTSPVKQKAFERLFRAHVRIRPIGQQLVRPAFFMPDLTPALRKPTALSVLLDDKRPSIHAANYLCEDILRKDKCAYHDIISWAHILQRALHDGSDWLDVENYESPVWQTLLGWLVRPHGCLEDTACHSSFVEIMSLPLQKPAKRAGLQDLKLVVREYPRFSTTRAVMFTEVVGLFMRTSIADYIRIVWYPNTCTHSDFEGLPSDILLNLSILQSPNIHITSRSPLTYRGDGESTLTALLLVVQTYVGVSTELSASHGGSRQRHPGVVRASFRSLLVAVSSAGFIDGSMTPVDRSLMVLALVRAVYLDPSLFPVFSDGISGSRAVFDAIMDTTCSRFPVVSDTVAIMIDILRAHTLAGSRVVPAGILDIGVALYCRLSQHDWLGVLDQRLCEFLHTPLNGDEKSAEHYYLYSLLAVTFVDGLESLRHVSAPCYAYTKEHICGQLPTLGKLIMLSDDARRDGALQRLASLLPSETWLAGIGAMQKFIISPEFATLYNSYKRSFHGTFFNGFEDRLVYSEVETIIPMLTTKLLNSGGHSKTALSVASVSTKLSECPSLSDPVHWHAQIYETARSIGRKLKGWTGHKTDSRSDSPSADIV